MKTPRLTTLLLLVMSLPTVLSAQILSRLTILRSWLPDRALKGRMADLQRDAMRAGIGGITGATRPKFHHRFASMVDGSGSQSIVAAVQFFYLDRRTHYQ